VFPELTPEESDDVETTDENRRVLRILGGLIPGILTRFSPSGQLIPDRE